MSKVLLQPVLFGGLFMGVLSALPIISLGNCCCVWVAGGGAVTAYLTIVFFIRLLERIGMLPFVVYRLILGVALLAWLA